MDTIREFALAAQQALDDFPDFCASAFHIVDKSGQKRLLELSSIQLKLWQAVKEQIDSGEPVRIVVLKARQIFVSTFFCALDLWLMLKRPIKGALIAHKDDAAQEVFGKIRFALDNMPEWFVKAIGLNPKKCVLSDKGIFMDFQNRNTPSIVPYTAGGKEIGRSGTLQLIHRTECAFYPNSEAVDKSLNASLPTNSGTFDFQESTGNGPVGGFHDLYEAAKNGENAYRALFFPWYEHEEYQMRVPSGKEVVVPDKLRPLYEAGKITGEQLYWRQWKIANDYKGDENAFSAEYPADEKEAWYQDAANFFPVTRVQERLDQIRDLAYDQGDLLQGARGPEFFTGTDLLRVFQYPVSGRTYVIGGDTSSGVSTAVASPDNSSADVLDALTGEQVAHVVVLCEPVEFAKKMMLLGQWYHNALINIEANGHGITVLNHLRDMLYPFLYHSKAYDHVNKTWINRLGFYTGPKTRPYLLDKGRSAFLTGAIKVNDQRTLVEMLAFVRNDKGRIAAIKGAHDDSVMSLMLANIAREEYQPMLVPAAGGIPDLREGRGRPREDAGDPAQALFQDVRRKHLQPQPWIDPVMGVFW